jgi:hypothetical protein
MKKLLTLSLALTLLSLSLIAQQTQYQWVKSAGGDNVTGVTGPYDQQMVGMAVDKEGNTYVSGTVNENVTLGDSILHRPNGSFGSYDCFMAKYDKCGKLIWRQISGGRGDDNFGGVLLSPDESYFISVVNLTGGGPTDSIVLHLQNRDTVIRGSYSAYMKVNTANGKILKLWPNLAHPTGAIYFISSMAFLSANRIATFLSIRGNFNGVNKSGYEGIIALTDSNLNIVKSHQIDSGMFYYYENDYGFERPSIEIDKYGNIYSGVILQPSNPSNVLHLFDTTFAGLAHGDGILFQLDSNLNLKRFKKTNSIPALHISAEDNLYLTGGVDASFYYDTTHFYGHSANVPYSPIYIKIDTSLNLKGYSYPRYTQYLQYMNLIKATTDKVYVGGVGFSDVKWGQDSLIGVANTYEMVVWEFPKDSIRPTKVHQGSPFGINTVVADFIGTDEQGNVSIGGTYGLSITTVGNTVYASGGSNSPNLFTLHWGLDCTDSTHALIAPLEPSALVATASSAHAVQVTWQDASRYEHSFHIYRSPDGVSGWTRIDSTLADATQYIDLNVQPHTAYWYRVAAWNENGESSLTNIDSALTWMDVGITETEATTIYLYPNPNTGTFTLLTTGTTHSDYTITDMLGAVIEQKPITTDKQSIDLNTAPAGVYTLSVKGSQPLRFVIVR